MFKLLAVLCLASTSFAQVYDGDDDEAGDFVRLFKSLPAYTPPEDVLVTLAASLQDPNLDSENNPNNTPSGMTYLGQFLDHDITLDLTPLELANDVNRLTNSRTARLDLDSVYGNGPTENPELYDAYDKFKFATPNGFEDFQRSLDGTAVVHESRNDENLVIAQIHLAFQKFHNRLIDQGHSFPEARRLTQWHWQWIVVHEFLPEIVGQPTVDRFLRYNGSGKPKFKGEFYKPGKKSNPKMPIEFAVAAYRFGHSMVRLAYVMPTNSITKTQVFNANGNDLRGHRIIPPLLKIDFNNFFNIPGQPVPPGRNISRKIDALISRSLFALPIGPVIPPAPPAITSLAERNLIRGRRLGLPSYQDVAEAMGIVPYINPELGLLDPAFQGEAPLWYGILKESELKENGVRLGPTGGRIVAEIILGLIAADKDSYFHKKDWSPGPGFGIAKLLVP